MPSDVAHHIRPQAWMTAPETRAVIDALRAGGAEVRFVGGCVRDAILGRQVQDVDIATPEPPERVMNRLEAAGITAVPTGIDHGTVTAVANHKPFEITTLREDVETYGRHAKVAFTDDWDADAARRDFTMNAMSCTPEGELHDPFGGYEDALAGRVRFVGDPRQRIEEDVLRLLRFYRFNAHYGRTPVDEAGREACRALAGRIPDLSVERVRDETLRLLAAPDPASMVEIMTADGVTAAYLPEARGIDRLRRIVALEERFAAPDAARRLAALLECGPDEAEGVAKRLRLSNAQVRRIRAALEGLSDYDPSRRERDWRARIYRFGAEAVRDATLLYWAGRPEMDEVALSRALSQTKEWTPPRMPVGGDDVRRLGIPPGPDMGALLRALEDWWIAGDFRAGREELLARLEEMAPEYREERG